MFPRLASITDQAGQVVVVGSDAARRITSLARPGEAVWA